MRRVHDKRAHALRLSLATAALIVLLVVTSTALAFNTLSFDGRTSLRWRDSALPVSYEIQTDFPATSGDGDISAIHESFTIWTQPSCSDVTFNFAGFSAGSGFTERDNHNKVVMTTSGFGSSTSGAVGVTYTEFSGDAYGWFISGADIAINAYAEWSVTGEWDKMDLKSVVTHEIGHLLGLQHTPVLAATMYYATAPGDTSQRDLHDDDRRGICYLYPSGTFSCSTDADCPSLDRNETDRYGNPLSWGRATCQPDGSCEIAGAPEGAPLGTICVSPADCSSGLCVPGPDLENNICSQACTLEPDNCPENFNCVDFGAEFGSVCQPVGTEPLGASCATSLECASALCIGVSENPEDPGVCSQQCDPSRAEPCPDNMPCFPTDDPTFNVCVPGGDTPFGSDCDNDLECEGAICLPVTDLRSTCSELCNPTNPEPCPPNAACWPVDEEETLHICIPGGTAAPGTPCESILDCPDTLCVPFSDIEDDYRCGQSCEFRAGVNDCPDGFQCFPFDIDSACLPAGDVPLGGTCDSIFDCQSLLCLTDGLCTELCTGSCPTGYACEDIGDGLGVCVSTGEQPADPGSDAGVVTDTGVQPDTGGTGLDAGGSGDDDRPLFDGGPIDNDSGGGQVEGEEDEGSAGSGGGSSSGCLCTAARPASGSAGWLLAALTFVGGLLRRRRRS